jgi:hypothetical protein
MIDPISAVAVATSAYKTITTMLSAGREIEDTLGQIGKWYGAIADFNEAKRQAENPPLFKKLFYSSSIEQEAMELFIQERKIKAQERDLRELLTFCFPGDAYKELTDMRRKIKDQREKTQYKQIRQRQAFVANTINCILIVVLSAITYGVFSLILNAIP